MPIRYTVVPTSSGDAALAELWNQAAPGDRPMITQASNHIDKELKEDAHLKGQLLSGQGTMYRVLRVAPLRVYFEVSEPDRLVWIRDYELAP
jgi:hypothetical protein